MGPFEVVDVAEAFHFCYGVCWDSILLRRSWIQSLRKLYCLVRSQVVDVAACCYKTLHLIFHLEFNGFVFISTINIRQTQTYMTKVKPKKTWKRTLSFRAMGNVKGWRKKRAGNHCGKLAPTLVFLMEWVAKRYLNIMHLKDFWTVGDHQHHQHHKQHFPIFANFTAQDGFHPGVSHTSE